MLLTAPITPLKSTEGMDLDRLLPEDGQNFH